MSDEWQKSIRFVDFKQPINELAYVGGAVLAYWDGSNKDTFKFALRESRVDYKDCNGPLTNEQAHKSLMESKRYLVEQYNILFLEGMKPFKLYNTLSQKQVDELYA